MATQWKIISVVSRFLLVYMLLAAVLPLGAHASSPPGSVPKVSVPQVNVPSVSSPAASIPPSTTPPSTTPPSTTPLKSTHPIADEPISGQSIPVPPVDSIGKAKVSSLGAKDVFKKVTKMTLGGREVIYKAMMGMNDTGKLKQGGWTTARTFTVKTLSPWIDLVGFDAWHVYFDAEGLLGQARNIKKSYDAYKALKDSTAAPSLLTTAGGAAQAGRLMGASFPVLGGTVGVITGSMDIAASFSDNANNAQADTVKFYSGVGSVLGGMGSIASGAAIMAAGTAVAPAVALAGTVLLAAGLICGAAAFGLQYSPTFRNSRIGRRLSGFKNWLGARL